MLRYLPLANTIASALTAILAELGFQHPAWTWVPITAGVVSMINLHVIPSLTQAYPPKALPQALSIPDIREKQS